MPTISYKHTPYFTDLIHDYISQNEKLAPLYTHSPQIENFEKQIELKKTSFPKTHRASLYNVLKKQYLDIKVNQAVEENILVLQNDNAFTITTGHQLNLMLGPIYFIYKILSVIKTCQMLQKRYPENHFIPIFWMASEDHDIEEINHFYFQNKKIQWATQQTGAAGKLDLIGIESAIEELKQLLPRNKYATEIIELLNKAYNTKNNLAQATKLLVNELFGKYGLVIIDGDDASLKKLFAPYAIREIKENITEKAVKKSFDILKNYHIQANPRDVNLFLLEKNERNRIAKSGDHFQIINTNRTISLSDLAETIQNKPEKISPNALLRPLYQEIILPNLAYIGGGGELAYWLELKAVFEAFEVPFPLLMLRNSALIVFEKQDEKRKKLELSWEMLFQKENSITQYLIDKWSADLFSFKNQQQFLEKQFQALYALVEKTDKSFANAVKAQEQKQLKGLAHLEKRFHKAQKKKHAEQLDHSIQLKKELFPNGGLQERQLNFLEIAAFKGFQWMDDLLENFDPFANEFNIIKM